MKVKVFVSDDLPSSGSGERYSSFPNLSLEAPEDGSISQPERKVTRKFDALCMLYLVAASLEDAEKEPKDTKRKILETETVKVTKKKHKPVSVKKPQAKEGKMCKKCKKYEGVYYPTIDYTVSFTTYKNNGLLYKNCDRCVEQSAKVRSRSHNN